jgi:hypothetical protein
MKTAVQLERETQTAVIEWYYEPIQTGPETYKESPAEPGKIAHRAKVINVKIYQEHPSLSPVTLTQADVYQIHDRVCDIKSLVKEDYL